MLMRTANNGTAVDCKDFDRDTLLQRLIAVVEKIFPRKTALNLAEVSGLKERAAYNFLAGSSSLSFDAVTRLLRSEHGRETLEALMDGADPLWWAEYRFLLEEARQADEAAERDVRRKDIQRRRQALRERP